MIQLKLKGKKLKGSGMNHPVDITKHLRVRAVRDWPYDFTHPFGFEVYIHSEGRHLLEFHNWGNRVVTITGANVLTNGKVYIKYRIPPVYIWPDQDFVLYWNNNNALSQHMVPLRHDSR